jgi:hypothetical protein
VTRELRHAYLTLWAVTAAGATLGIAGVHMFAASAPHDALPATPGTAAALLAHNAPVALWPLALIALGWPRLRGARAAGHALVAGQLLAHGLMVGNALGQHPALWRYLPHLPLEWLALATPAGAWLATRRDTPASRQWLGHSLAAAVGVLALAAIVETYLVPLP